jgi:hypothetical protein
MIQNFLCKKHQKHRFVGETFYLEAPGYECAVDIFLR